ncbi:hypothetical protein [Candidatus Enterovibrio escicola]|uniref:hypothetical protein n=1 Tax=Candidatus Enterovibrio escicola TaxID=1927127 RepID=UPI0012381F4C|nr:hypothetical protein [Candidatus Enterovibrio escacola]
MKEDKLAEWKKNGDYHKRSLEDTGMFHYKQLLNSKLTLHDHNAHVGETLVNVKAINKVIKLGMPIHQQIN